MVIDRRRGVAVLASDPFGTSPLFYATHEVTGAFGGASTSAALLRRAVVMKCVCAAQQV